MPVDLQIERMTVRVAPDRRLFLHYVFGIAFVAAPVLAAVAPLGLAPLFGVTALAALLAYLAEHRTWPPMPHTPVAIAVAFVGWSALSALWSGTPSETLLFVPRMALTIAGGLTLLAVARSLPASQRSVVDLCLLIGVVLGSALLAIEITSDAAIARGLHHLVKGGERHIEAGALNRGGAFFAIFAFPAALAARRRYGWPLAAAVLAAILSVTLMVQGQKAALGAGIGVAIVASAYVLGQRIVPLLAAAIVALIVIAPMQPWLLRSIPGPWVTSESPSVQHRLLIWRFVSERIAEKPVLGWGANSSRALPGGKSGPQEGTEQLPLHPHNIPMQFWVELGGIGALIAAVGFGTGVLRLGPMFRERTEIGLAAATVGAAVAAGAVGYGLWQGWWLGTIWLALAALSALAPASPGSGAADELQ